jgi:regulator of nucleoside diphosphate kinase
MNNQMNLHLSTADHQVLSRLIAGVPGKNATLERLRGELARAIVLDPAVVPANAVGLNSRVVIEDLDTHEREEYVLVLPSAANPDQQLLSVLAPVGTALLGFSEGDEIEWPTPGGSRRLKLLRVTRDAPAA